MGRASLNCPTEMGDYVVICSQLAHYSIEHVCHYLGISPENCVRVEAKQSGEMDPQSLEKTMGQVITQGKRIAAIIAVGGGTVNLVPDQILSVKQTIDRAVRKYQLNYTPYLHVDSVITWPWLAFEKAPNTAWKHQLNPTILKKIEHVLSNLSGIQYADSFAADFHKTGFCPYAAGVFIAKDSKNLAGMTLDRSFPKKTIRFGEAEIYRQTLENSRPGLAIASIWIALRRMGLEGFRNFVLYQLEVCEIFKKKIRKAYSAHFEILNDYSNGWEIVLKPNFGDNFSWDQLQEASSEEKEEYITTCHQFFNSFWFDPLDDENSRTPLIGFIRNYSKKGSHQQNFPALLIHPSSLHYDKDTIDEMLEGLVHAKLAFDGQIDRKSKAVEKRFSQLVPPK